MAAKAGRAADFSPCWRPLLQALANHVPVRQLAGVRAVPDWLKGESVEIIRGVPATPHQSAIGASALLITDDAAQRAASGKAAQATIAGISRDVTTGRDTSGRIANMSKGSDLSIYWQDDLDAIAVSLNTAPRASFNFEVPLVVYTRYIALLQHPTDTVN